jgi:hypothetical protein
MSLDESDLHKPKDSASFKCVEKTKAAHVMDHTKKQSNGPKNMLTGYLLEGLKHCLRWMWLGQFDCSSGL